MHAKSVNNASLTIFFTTKKKAVKNLILNRLWRFVKYKFYLEFLVLQCLEFICPFQK